MLEAFPKAGQVVRLTADCPLTDPLVIDGVIEGHLEMGADYSTNAHEGRSFPVGLDVEVMTPKALRQAAAEGVDPYEREHVTPFIHRRPERFHVRKHDQEAAEGDVRWTVDRPDDYAFVSEVYDALHPSNPTFTSDDIRAFVRDRPDLHFHGGDRRV